MVRTLRKRSPDAPGFTLVELLATITILGALAAVVVLATGGVTPRARTASCDQDASTISTAEEAYDAQHGAYTSMTGLVAAGLLDNPSTLHTVTLAGSAYTVAASAGGPCWTPPQVMTLASAGWSTHGPTVLASALTLTPQANNSQTVGSAWIGPISSASFSVDFDVTVKGGYGLTLAFVDPSAGMQAAGANQGGRGFGGLVGTAVVLGTSKTSGDPGSNFMGIATGWASNHLTYAQTTTTRMSRLTTAPHHVVATVADGRLTVTYDGTQVLTSAVTLPSKVLVGFTGSSSSKSNAQQVSNVTITT